MIVVPVSFSAAMVSQASRRAAGSKPVVGSSRNSTCGRPVRARARSSFRCWPPESWVARWPGVREVAAVQAQALGDGQAGFRPGFLQHDTDPGAPLATCLPGVGAQHADLAAGAAPVAFEDLHGAGLAGAVGTEEGEQLATEHLEAKPGEGLA